MPGHTQTPVCSPEWESKRLGVLKHLRVANFSFNGPLMLEAILQAARLRTLAEPWPSTRSLHSSLLVAAKFSTVGIDTWAGLQIYHYKRVPIFLTFSAIFF